MVISRRPSASAALRFMEDILGSQPWSKQEEIVKSAFGPHRITAVQSCTGAGKTKIAADAALAWLCTAPGRMVISTAPTGRQVSELLWKEIRQSYARAAQRGTPIGGYMPPRAPELRIKDGWLALGFSSGDEVNFQGWHSHGGTLCVVDEAVGVSNSTFDALEGTLTGENDRLLALANPTVPAGRFYDWCRQGGVGINRIKISAFDTPNVLAGSTIIPGLTTRGFIEDKRQRWGEGSALWSARILGEFPDQADNVLCPLSWVDAAVERWKDLVFKDMVPTDGTEEAGADIARMGADRSVLCRIRRAQKHTWVHQLAKKSKADTMEVAGWIALAIKEHGLASVRIDGDGLGAGVFDRLAELGHPVVEMRGGMRAHDPSRFFNARSEWLWALREALRPDATVPLCLPPDEGLTFQLTSIRYKLDSSGRIALESKDDWKKRSGKDSPDELDAVAYALASGSGATNGVEAVWV